MPWALVVAAVLSQAQQAHLQAARAAMDELKYPEARALLQKARQQQGLEREELVQILWMQGLVAASMNQPDLARSYFRTLFAIEPEHKPERDYPPKIMSPYYEARGWIATNKPLGFAKAEPVVEGGRVRRIGVTIQADPLALVTGVRIWVAGAEMKELDFGKDLAAWLDVDAERVSWWAELIGERNATLASLGSEKQPLVDAAKAADPEAQPAPAAALPQAEDSPPTPPLRLGAYAAAAGAIASFGVGLVFGIRSNNMKNALQSRTYDADGVVIGWMQMEAIQLELQQRREAGVANAMIATAVVLAAAAVVLFIMGREP